MPVVVHSKFQLGDMQVRYEAPAAAPDQLALVIFPASRANDVVTPREYLETAAVHRLPRRWRPVSARSPDALVQLQIQGRPYAGGFAQGRTLRGGFPTGQLQLIAQNRRQEGEQTEILTEFSSAVGLSVTHRLAYVRGETTLTLCANVKNTSTAPLPLELLSSFSLSGITPFAEDDAPDRLWLHRFRSAWCAEGRHEMQSIEQLGLERSWVGHGVRAERFGQVGSLPTNGFFPLVVVEDRKARVFWGAKVACPGSWQLEVFRRGDQLGLSGGLADREFGHWWKTLQPGESFQSPESFVTVCSGDLDETCDRLNRVRPLGSIEPPAVERELPVIFNEWCTSWGNPTAQNLVSLADCLRGSGVKYLVIDDGWAERPSEGIQQNGDWITRHDAFPAGLRVTADAIRERGLIPGIWFEFEVVNQGSRAWHETEHLLHRDGVPLQVGSRRFWDFRDPWVHDYLSNRVTGLLREGNFGYLKVDYNDTIGLGCDGADSPGEGLREHLSAVQRFFRQLRKELPDLVVENCSSGGHRAEPSMIALTSMTSASDAHETPDLPVIAANLNRLIPPTQSQVWAVLRKEDSRQRLSYSLASAFLGRMCLSGDVPELSPSSWAFVREGVALYRELCPLLVSGRFRRHWSAADSYQHLTGAQLVVRETLSGEPLYIVWHCFAQPPPTLSIRLPSGRSWSIRRDFGDQTDNAMIKAGEIHFQSPRPWSGGVVVLA